MKIFRNPTQNVTFRSGFAPLIISLTLLFSIIIIASTPPATGYELSIYEAYPTFLWVLLSINIFFSIYTILQSGNNHSRNLYYGYFSILLIETIIIFLPVIRGYYAMHRGSADLYYHMFVASQILNSGYLPVTDIYPLMHIWLSILDNFLHDFIILILVLSIVFFYMYVLFLYILGKTILGTKSGGIFFSIFSIPLIFSLLHYSFIPFFFALLTFPILLYIYHKIINNPYQNKPFYICIIFLSFFIVFCHPMITVFFIIMFSIFALIELIRRRKTLSWYSNNTAFNIVTIESIAFFIWIINFSDIQDSLKDIVSASLGQKVYTTIFENQMETVTNSNASIWLVIDRFIKIYSPLCLYFLISLFFLFYIIYQYYRNRNVNKDDFIYSFQFCVAICVGISLLTGYFVIAEPIRAMAYALIFATILCGLFFYRIRVSTKSEKQELGLNASITMIITIVCMLTMMTLYSSPWIGLPSTALTNGDKSGNDWILEYRNAAIPIVKEEQSNYKYASYYFETTRSKNSQNVREYTTIIPSHFGYNTNQTMGNSFTYLPDDKVYMITSVMLKLTPDAIPVDRREQIKKFTETDFNRLKNDPTVDLIYSGKEFGVWKIII